MRFAAILIECQVGTGFSIGGRGNRRILLGVALAASHKSVVVVVFTVRAHADRADHAREIAVIHVVNPQIAASA